MVCFANKSRSREIIGCLPGFTHTGEMKAFLAGVAHNVAQIQKQGFAKIGCLNKVLFEIERSWNEFAHISSMLVNGSIVDDLPERSEGVI